ncbi:MAG: protein kinase [Planctomycetes bacterium]|nr:protein kinase [Planctomycetota bacterium]
MTTAPQAAPAGGALEAGAVLGEFRLRRLLGQGPLGELYAAERAEDGARVLLRVLADQVTARADLRARVGRDLAALQGVEHPAVARLLELGEERGHVFYGLADPGDLSLGDLVRRGRPLDERELVWLGAGVAAGLGALHAANLPHGSLAPHTVLVTPRGPVVVDLAWTCRLREPSGEAEAGDAPPPSVAHDLRALGLLLVLAGTGDPAARALPAGTSPRLAGLVELLLGPAARRPPAEKVARLFAQLAKVAEVEGGAPASLVGLIEQVAAGQTTGPLDAAAGPALGRFGRYVLLEELGRGGMGVVYKARHAELERYFALKVMLAGALADDTARRRFLHEAEAAATLDHPAVVRVHDCGVVDGRAYMAMDLMAGTPLSELYRDPAWTLPALLGLFVEVLRGVHYAHSRGIVHRDLKPENVLVDAEGKPHILDFGVAKRVGEASGLLTIQGELVGTPAYMPPEQAEGRGNDIDTRSDVYALGASLFEVVTRGRRPFEGKTVTDVLTRILLEEPPAPGALAPGLPWEVDAIVLKALEKQRERRYQSAAEMAEDIQRFLGGLPIRARQATFGYKARKWLARRWPAVVAGAAALSLAVGGAAVVVAGRRADAAAEAARVAAEATRVAAEVRRLVEEGDAALGQDDPQLAIERYAQALALEPDHVAASVGRERAVGQVKDAEARARRARAREQAEAFARDAAAQEAAGDLQAARVAFEKAMAFEDPPPAARTGLLRVAQALAVREAQDRTDELQRRDLRRAADHEAAGDAHLAAGRLRDAQAAFLQAMGFGSERAPGRLRQVEEALLAERMEQVQEEVRARAAAEAERLAKEGLAALDRDDLDGARRAFVQALGFDGNSAAAQQGLVEVERLRRADQERQERAGRLAQADEQARQARQALERGRAQFRDGEDVEVVRESYFLALEGYDRALSFVPDHARARAEKAAVAREVSAILREEGRYELADFLLRMSGVEAGAAAAPPELPADPHLVVVEADKVNIRRAYGGVVRFQATRVFDPLREQVRARGGGRYRVVIQVRSEPTASIPPLVHAKGLWVRLEDKVANTISRTERVDFQGGPFARLVTVDAHGRIVAAWERSRDLPAQRYIAEVEAVVRRLLAEVEGRGGG